MMVKPIDANDMAMLTPAQKSSLFEALYMVIAIDRKLEPAELEAFDVEVGRIPWVLDTAMFELIRDKARLRVKSTLSRDAWVAWIKEIAALLGSQSLREKILRTQALIALRVTRDPETSVRTLINEFAHAFELPASSIQQLRSELVG